VTSLLYISQLNESAFSWLIYSEFRMHGEGHIKFISAQQARLTYKYQNIKEKLLKTNVSIWFNKICKANESVFSWLIYSELRMHGEGHIKK
jgi:hypothetical protein